MKEYIEKKISSFLNENGDPEIYLMRLANVDKEIGRMWKEEYNNKHTNWRRIKKNQDVIDLINVFDNTVLYTEKNVRFGNGHIEDGYHMALAEYKALQGLRKMAQFMDPSLFINSEFTMLSKTEVNELFEQMRKICQRMDRQNICRMMQD